MKGYRVFTDKMNWLIENGKLEYAEEVKKDTTPFADL